LDQINESRRSNAIQWDDWCNQNNIKRPVIIPDSIPVYLRYPIIVDERKKKSVLWAMKKLNVKPGIWFCSNIHPSNIKVPKCPAADIAVKGCINFPV
jgi:hypothetical protein